jgi:hypothetical protein
VGCRRRSPVETLYQAQPPQWLNGIGRGRRCHGSAVSRAICTGLRGHRTTSAPPHVAQAPTQGAWCVGRPTASPWAPLGGS